MDCQLGFGFRDYVVSLLLDDKSKPHHCWVYRWVRPLPPGVLGLVHVVEVVGYHLHILSVTEYPLTDLSEHLRIIPQHRRG